MTRVRKIGTARDITNRTQKTASRIKARNERATHLHLRDRRGPDGVGDSMFEVCRLYANPYMYALKLAPDNRVFPA